VPTEILKPQVGVGVIVIRGGKVLLGLRRGSHGAGTWALPGGHLEWGETVENCARREVKEETGLDLGLVGQGPYTSDVMATEGKHYVTCFVEAAALPGEARILEPTKCERWDWFQWSAMPEELFQPLRTLVRSGYVPDESKRGARRGLI
jgi:8-oxo-dGTP diphosphatase